jgi:nitrogen fixation protein FixH
MTATNQNNRGTGSDYVAGGNPLTGRKVLMVAAGAFAVILAANLTLAFSAVGTFPGLEVRNSYVASQGFDARRQAQQALGWDASVAYGAQELVLTLTGPDGAQVQPETLAVRVGRPTMAAADQILDMTLTEAGYVAPVVLERGEWRVFVDATAADGTLFKTRLGLSLRGQ